MQQPAASIKPKVAIYWTASCGGCECSVIDIGETLLDVVSQVELVLWPVAMDFKYKDIKAMDDKSIDLCLFNGAIRTSEQEEMAVLLRKKSKLLVAFGSCAHLGGIPGLADFSSRQAIMQTLYNDVPTLQNKSIPTMPQTEIRVKEGTLKLPEVYDSVYRLRDIVEVDYSVPGCPPTSEQAALFLMAVLKGNLPEKGTVFGPKKNLCDECPRERKEKAIKVLHRPHEKKPNTEECLLDQGFFCMGPVTRAGCRAQCISANMSCRGCYGPTDNIEDMGSAFISTLASVIESNDEKEICEIIDKIPDLAGTVYRFALPSCTIEPGKNKREDKKEN